MTRRRPYERHNGDAFDRFITERTRGEDGAFSLAKLRDLANAIDFADDWIPYGGSNGTKRMTFGICLRSAYPTGEILFKDGTKVQLDLEGS